MPAPVGSIVAFAGTPNSKWEDTNGWMLCDGRQLDRRDYPDLFDAIGSGWGSSDRDFMFNLPDLVGRFLRGVDGPDTNRDPDHNARTESKPGGNTGNIVGTLQGFLTKLPILKVSSAGAHSHDLDFEVDASRDVDGQDNTVAYPALEGAGRVQTGLAGPHDHHLTGGEDAQETRPVNAAVHWIIRVK